jgi:hypothetical protein
MDERGYKIFLDGHRDMCKQTERLYPNETLVDLDVAKEYTLGTLTKTLD